jgi:lincosamide nucleotidyltransferase A/C/D/E
VKEELELVEKEMKIQDVLNFIDICEENDIEIWVDGGWGVDSLLGAQTRAHNDLDVALRHSDVNKIRGILGSRGYTELKKDDSSEYNFVLRDDAGHEIDFHSFELNDDGSNKLGVAYIADHLKGEGIIGDRLVKTIDPEWMVEFHTWYEPDEDDYHDVKLLCEKYDIPIPKSYKKFHK